MPKKPAQLAPREIPASAKRDPAFHAGLNLTYPPPEWWRAAFVLVPPPTPAKYWTQFSLARLLKLAPLPGRTRQKAANQKRVRLARQWKRELEAAEVAGIARSMQWRIGFAGELDYHQGTGPETVAKVNQSSPWQPLTPTPSHDEIQALYWDVCRAAIRGSTGFTKEKDNRHGPSWTPEDAPTTSTFLSQFPPDSLTYDNSNLYPTRVVLYVRTRPRPKGVRDKTWTLYRAGKGVSKPRSSGGAEQLGEPERDDFGAF